MKLKDKDYQVKPDAARHLVQLQVKIYGMCAASETVTPEQARQFARELDAAADAAEGGAL